MLGASAVKLDKNIVMRQVRRRLECGREVTIVSAHPMLSTEQVASIMFSLWSQKNFIKYFNTVSVSTRKPETLGNMLLSLYRIGQRVERRSKRVPTTNFDSSIHDPTPIFFEITSTIRSVSE